MKRYLRSLPLLILAVLTVVACSSRPSDTEPTATLSQPLLSDGGFPTVSCSSNPNVFNTGYNAATNGVLANNTSDANWLVAGPTNSGSEESPTTKTTFPVGLTFAPANVGNLVPGPWSLSPTSSVQWISQQTTTSPTSPTGDWYYEYNFNLDSSVAPGTFSLALNMMSDNEVATIWVNGVNQAGKISGIPQDATPGTTDPYQYVGYNTAAETSVTLNNSWVTGPNTIIVQVKSGQPEQGFIAWAKPTAFCAAGLAVTKTASPSPYVAGSTLTYTITVTNTGSNVGAVNQVTVSDPLPAQLAGAGFTWTCAAATGSFCTASGTGNISDTPSLGSGGTVTYTLSGTVPAATTATLSNTVTVAPPSGVSDPGCSPSCSATNTDLPPPTATTTTVVSSLSPTVYGQAVTFTATVLPVGATGTVTFVDTVSGTQIGSPVTLSGTGTASTTTTALEVGSDAVTATFNPSNNYKTSTGSVTQTVKPDSTTTALTSSGSPAGVGSPVTFTATVGSNLPGGGAPTGTVTFYDDTGSLSLDAAAGTFLGTGTLTTGGATTSTATFATASLSVGIHTIVAIYGGSTNYTGSASGGFLQTIAIAAPSIVVTSSSPGNTSTYGSSVTITATVGAAVDGGPGPTGTVTFNFPGGPQTVTLVNGVATITLTTLPGGTDTITATYSGDGNYSGATGSVTQTVTDASTATTLTSGANPAVYGQSVPLTATVAGVSGGATPTGSVSFYEGGGPGDDGGAAILLGTVALNGSSNQATLTPTGLVPGAYTIYAVYSGDGNYATSTSTTLTENVNQAATTTALSPSSNPAGAGASVTFTATVAPVAPGAGTPTGTVTFSDGGTVIGTGTLSLGVATFSTATLSEGTHSITATYSGDADFTASTSSVLSEVISANATTVTITTSGSPSGYGQAVTFTATVTSSNGIPTGTITFTDGGTTLGTGTLTLGVTTYTTSSLGTGTHTITATYGGDSTHAGGTASLTQVVNAASTTTSLTASPLLAVYGQPVTLTATVASAAAGSTAPTGSVQFSLGATVLGSATLSAGGTATLSVTALPIGLDSITATYSGDTNYGTSTSGPVVVTVGQAATTAGIASSSNPSVLNSSVTFTATIAATAPGAGTPTGTVTFNDGLLTLGTGTLSGGVATYSTSSLTVGTHSITAVYGGDVDFAGSTSSVLSQVVTATGASETLTATPSPGTYGGTETLTATVTGSSGTPTGTVTFSNGATTLGTGTLAAGTTSITTKTLPVGKLTLTATYEGDTTYAETTATTALTIDVASTTTKVTSSANPSAPGEAVTFTATVSSAVTGFTGTVEFLDGTTSLGTVALSGASATLTTSTLSVGTHSITAVYSGDTDFGTSTSPAVSQVVETGSDGGAGDGGNERDAGDGGGIGAGDGGKGAGDAGDGGNGAGDAGDGGGSSLGDGGNGDGGLNASDGGNGGADASSGDGGGPGTGEDSGPGSSSGNGNDGGDGTSIGGGGFGCSVENAGGSSGGGAFFAIAGMIVVGLRRRRRAR